MDVNNVSMGRQEPFRKLDFENNENSSDFYEAEVVDTNDENKSGDHSDTHVSESKDEIHSRVSKELIPEMGMEFETENDAYEFYLSYAKAAGFGVRIWKSHKDKETSRILDRVFCCSREGARTTDVRDANVKSRRAITRCHCPAKMKISCRQVQKYRVVKFVAEHNHNCVTPSKSHFFRSNRRMTNAQKAEVDLVLSCGISQRDTMELLAKQAGGPEQLGFLRDDCKNYSRSKRMNKMMLGDTGGVFEYLQRRQGEDPNFFSAIQVDEDDLITNIFWADVKMKLDYSYLITRAAESQKGYEIVRAGLQKLLEELDACFEKGEVQGVMRVVENVHMSNPISSNENISCKTVRVVKAKDKITYKKSKRLKSSVEKKTTKKKRNLKSTMPISENQNNTANNENVNEITPHESSSHMMDPNVAEQQVFTDNDPNHLHVPNNLQVDEQED